MPPYNIKFKVNDPSHILVDEEQKQETGWIDGTHAFEATLTGVAAGPNGGANPAATASIKVTISVSHTDVSGVSVPEVTISIA